MRARLLRASEQLVRVDRAEPGGDARLEVGEADRFLHQPAEASLRDVVARVDGNLSHEVGVQQVLALEQLVQPLDRAVEVGIEAAAVDELAERGNVARDLLDPGVDLRRVRRREEGSEIPMRKGFLDGHRRHSRLLP